MGPENDGFLVALFAFGKSHGALVHPEIVVELLRNGGPVLEAAGDRVGGIGVGDLDRRLLAMPAGLEAEVVEPEATVGAGGDGFLEIGIAAVGMHGAVEIHARQTLEVGSEDAADHRDVIDIGGALAVEDDVVAGGPVVLLITGEGRFGALVGGITDVDRDIGALLDAALKDVFLCGVVMAAAANNKERLERFHGRRGGEGGGQRNDY